MSITTYQFWESGVIPGIPRDEGGEGHAGLLVEVDTETNTVVARRLASPLIAPDPVSTDLAEEPQEEDHTTQPLPDASAQEADETIQQQQGG